MDELKNVGTNRTSGVRLTLEQLRLIGGWAISELEKIANDDYSVEDDEFRDMVHIIDEIYGEVAYR